MAILKLVLPYIRLLCAFRLTFCAKLHLLRLHNPRFSQNKVPKDQKTQTYARSISDFPTPTDALMWYLEGEKKAASEAKRQAR